MPGVNERADCAARNYCIVTESSGPPCGLIPEHRNPLLSAEQVCVSALYGQLERAERGSLDSRSDNVHVRSLQVASAHLELGLSPSLGEADTDDHFNEAEALLGKLSASRSLRMPDLVQAQLLTAYLPAFEARRWGTVPDEAGATKLSASVAAVYSTVQTAPGHNRFPRDHRDKPGHEPCVATGSERRLLADKVATLLLLGRMGLAAYPSSYRERHTDRPDYRPVIHDHTFIVDGVKIPVRNIGKKPGATNADPRLLALPYGRISYWATTANAPDTDRDNRALTDEVSGWLVDEASGRQLEPTATKLLDTMGALLTKRIAKHIRRSAAGDA